MAVFKKLKKSKDKAAPLPEPEPVKSLDCRVGMDNYRDFFTLKNYWKTVDRKKPEAAGLLIANSMGSGSSAQKPPAKVDEPPVVEAPAQATDIRLKLNFKEFFTTKNYWKTIRRNEQQCGKSFLAKFLTQNPDQKALYPKLKNLPATVDATCSETAFENIAANYLKVFDEVISAVEEKPNDVQAAIDRLKAIGKMHRSKVPSMSSGDFQNMEEPFIYMVEQILQDRFNDKAHTLFKKFFQFCLQYLQEGFNG